MLMRQLRSLTLLMSIGASVSCVSSIDPGVELTKAPSEDKEYYKVYKEATRSAEIIRDFGLTFKISATYLYPGFRNELARRLKELYLQDAGGGAFSEANSKSGFFVTIYGDERDSTDLSNTNHWTILLDGKDGSQRPVLVRKITDKQRWRNFFDSVSPWSTDFLVVFDAPAANPGAQNLVEKPHVKLVIAHGEGKVTMDW